MKKAYIRTAVSAFLAVLIAFSCMTVAFAAEATVVKKPDRTTFYQGIDWSYNKAGTISVIGSFDLTGTVLSYNSETVEYKMGDRWPNMYYTSPAGGWKVGNNTMKIKCDDFPSSVYAPVTVKLVAVDSITVINPPKKTILRQDTDWKLSGLGDVEFTEIDLTGISLNVRYTDGTVRKVSYSDNKLIGWAVAQGVDSIEPGYATLYATFCGKRAPFTVNFLAKDAYLYGDANSDYKINSIDALSVLQHSVNKIELTGRNKVQADATKDGKINSIDALLILQYTVGIVQSI